MARSLLNAVTSEHNVKDRMITRRTECRPQSSGSRRCASSFLRPQGFNRWTSSARRRCSGKPRVDSAIRSAYEVQVMGTTAGAVCGTGSLRFLADCSTIYDPDRPIDTLLVGGDPSFDAVDPAVTGLARPARPHGAPLRLGVHRGVSSLPRPGCSTAATSPPVGSAPTIVSDFPNLSSTTARSSSAMARYSPRRASPRGGPRARPRRGGFRSRARAHRRALHGDVPERPVGQSQFSAPSRRADVDPQPNPAGAGLRARRTFRPISRSISWRSGPAWSTRNFARVFRRDVTPLPPHS